MATRDEDPLLLCMTKDVQRVDLQQLKKVFFGD